MAADSVNHSQYNRFDSIGSILDALQRRVDLEHVGEDPGTFRSKVVVANTASKCSLVSDEKNGCCR